MHINLESDYAARIVYCLTKVDGRLDAQSIAEETCVSLRFTLKIMRKLVAAGIVRSFKGAKGGYQLARGPESVTLRQVIEAVERVNEGQKSILFGKLQRALGDLHGKTIAIWGLAFKPETDDMREAPALVVIDLLRKAGATVRVYDPVAMEEARRRIGDEGVHYAGSMYEAAKGADAIALVTEWKQFRMPDWPQLLTLMRDNILVDGRNIFDKEEVLNAGLRYYGIGK